MQLCVSSESILLPRLSLVIFIALSVKIYFPTSIIELNFMESIYVINVALWDSSKNCVVQVNLAKNKLLILIHEYFIRKSFEGILKLS